MRVLVWQWGRRGAGPRMAMLLAQGINALPGCEAALSLAAGAEILQGSEAPACAFVVPTYTSAAGLAGRVLAAPLLIRQLRNRIRVLQPDLAVCAMPGPLDLAMMAALHRAGVPVAVIVHDAEAHPGDAVPLLLRLQRTLLRRADAVVVLSRHVANRLRAQGAISPGAVLVEAQLPPLFATHAPPPFAHGGPARALFLGRLLAYKGLDLLAEALARLGPETTLDVRVVGHGPESGALAALRRLANVAVENRWVPEAELPALIGWADLLVLPYTEASQSGIASAALAAGRFVLATQVGGLTEQLDAAPRAFLCKPDAAGLAEALARFAADRPTPGGAVACTDPSASWRGFAETILEHATNCRRFRSRDHRKVTQITAIFL